MNIKILTLKDRADFVTISKRGVSFAAAGFILQSLKRGNDNISNPRLGFTVSKKVGNAVERNRVKRRLRHAASSVFSKHAKPFHDYVLIGRKSALDIPFSGLVKDMERILQKIS